MIDHNWQRSELWCGFDCVVPDLPRLGRNKCQGCGLRVSDKQLAEMDMGDTRQWRVLCDLLVSNG